MRLEFSTKDGLYFGVKMYAAVMEFKGPKNIHTQRRSVLGAGYLTLMLTIIPNVYNIIFLRNKSHFYSFYISP